jgi:hypothetical protein
MTREELERLCTEFLLSHNAQSNLVDTRFETDDHAFFAVTILGGTGVIIAETHADATDPEPSPEKALAWVNAAEDVPANLAVRQAFARNGFVRYQLLGLNEQNEVQGIGTSPKIAWEMVFPNVGEAFESLKARVEGIASEVETTTDSRTLIDQVRDLREHLKTALVHKDQRDELFGALNQVSDTLGEKRKAEHSAMEQESQAQFDRLNPQVDEWLEKVQTVTEFKPAREAMIALQNELKGTRMTRDHKNLLFDKLDIAFKALKQRQDAEWENYEAECEGNYKRLNTKIEEAAQMVEKAEIFKDAREQLIALQGEIREAKLFREKRQEFHDAMDAAFQRLRARQEEENERFEEYAELNYLKCKAIAEEATNIVNNTGDDDNYTEAKQQVRALLHQVFDCQPMRQKQKREIVAIVKEAEDRLYANAQAFFNRRKQERDQFHKRREEQFSNWQDRIKAKIRRLEETADRIILGNAKDRDYLEEIETKLNFVFKGSAVSEIKQEYEKKTVQMKKRMDENEEKIVDIRREIAELRQKLKDGDQGEHAEPEAKNEGEENAQS